MLREQSRHFDRRSSFRGHPQKVVSRWGRVPIKTVLAALATYATLLPQNAHSETSARLGGDLTSDLPFPLALQVAAPNVTAPERRELQASGFAPFHRLRTQEEGLGPLFVNNSCGGCHVNNGRGPANVSRSPALPSQMVVKLRIRGRRGLSASEMGSQLLDHSTQGSAPLSARLSWALTEGQYHDGTRYQLRTPKVILHPKNSSAGRVATSLRMAPPIIGPGLLEAVPWTTLFKLSFAQDALKDGVTGRLNWVKDARSGALTVGRFGFKATHPTVEQQTAAALYTDMRMTNPIFHDENLTAEVSESELSALTMYQRLGGVPAARSQSSPRAAAGKGIFFSLGCELCHRSTLFTGKHKDPELTHQTIHPYSDLLIHNMGPGLADGVQELGATGAEWKTTPLWGLHLLDDRSKASVYLHDGRARTIEEAILWHGGEAARAQHRFTRLSKRERADLIHFLRSL